MLLVLLSAPSTTEGSMRMPIQKARGPFQEGASQPFGEHCSEPQRGGRQRNADERLERGLALILTSNAMNLHAIASPDPLVSWGTMMEVLFPGCR